MKTAWSMLAAVVLLVAVTVSARAEDKKADAKEVTLKGTMVCGKCTLKETEECSNVLQVKKGDKTINYYLIDNGKAEKKYHQCPPGKKAQATVTGVVSKKDGKMYIKPSKVVLTKKS